MSKILKEIKCPKRNAVRETVKVETELLYSYLNDPNVASSSNCSYDDWLKSLNVIGLHLFNHDQPITSTGQEGSQVVSQPFAAKLASLTSNHLGGAIGLILMIETCYEPTLGDPSRLPEVLVNHYRLICYRGLVDTSFLHHFLEVEMDFNEWADAFRKPKKKKSAAYDYVKAATRDPAFNQLDYMTKHEALVAIHKTNTLRSKKIKDCLYTPISKSPNLAKYDPDCLKLLFTPPVRGAVSLYL